jgi:DNA-binding GntR family transcriptional regulator
MKLSAINRTSSLGSQAYERIRAAIASGSLNLGEKITERSLAKLLQISPTPIREALKRLEHEGLVVRKGPKSLTVADKSETGIAEIVYIEAVLRGIACRFAAAKITEEELGEIQSIYERAKKIIDSTTGDEMLKLSRRFHGIIIDASGNDLLARTLETTGVFDASHRLLSLNEEILYKTSHHKKSLKEHYDIFKALKARDGERAERLMVQHSMRVNKVFFKHLNDRQKFG